LQQTNPSAPLLSFFLFTPTCYTPFLPACTNHFCNIHLLLALPPCAPLSYLLQIIPPPAYIIFPLPPRALLLFLLLLLQILSPLFDCCIVRLPPPHSLPRHLDQLFLLLRAPHQVSCDPPCPPNAAAAVPGDSWSSDKAGSKQHKSDDALAM